MKLNFSLKTIETVKSYTYMTDRFMMMAFDKTRGTAYIVCHHG